MLSLTRPFGGALAPEVLVTRSARSNFTMPALTGGDIGLRRVEHIRRILGSRLEDPDDNTIFNSTSTDEVHLVLQAACGDCD